MKPVWLVVAVVLAAFLVWRRRRLEPTLLVGGVIAVVAVAVYGSGVIQLPNLEESLIRIGETLGAWTYLLVGALAFAETGAFIGLIAPGETAMMLGGLVAGQGQINVVTLIGIVWACAVAGDLTSFFLGRETVAVDARKRSVIPDGAGEHVRNPFGYQGVHDPAFNQTGLHRPLDGPRRAHPVDGAHVQSMAAFRGLARVAHSQSSPKDSGLDVVHGNGVPGQHRLNVAVPDEPLEVGSGS